MPAPTSTPSVPTDTRRPSGASATRGVQPIAAGLVATAEAASALAVHLAVTSGSTDVPAALAERVAAVAALVTDGVPIETAAAGPAAAFIRTMLAQAALFAAHPDQPPNWAHDDAAVLLAQGQASAAFGPLIQRALAPRLAGLVERLDDGGAVLDVGVGVGALAISLARAFPTARLVGIDVWPPSLRLAVEQVAAAGVGERVELREQDVRELPDRDRFDLVWFPGPFIAPDVVPAALTACAASLRPGGWLLHANYRGSDPLSSALADLRTYRSGGAVMDDAEIFAALRAAGLVDAARLDVDAGLPAGFVAARRPQAATSR